MKILHCADLHLDSKMQANLSKEKAKIRKNELLNTFIRMVDYAYNNDIEAVIIAGDLFDTKTVSATARNVVYDGICKYPEIEFFYLKGNHDENSFLSALEEIPDNLKLFDENWVEYSPKNSKTIRIYGAEINKANSNKLYNSLVLDNDNFNIVVLHGQESQYQGKDKTEIINLSALKYKGIDYLALGHIHSYKEGSLDARAKYCYSGCIEGRGFDECGEHGFVVIDIDEDKKNYVSQFVPFAYRNIYTKEIDITGCMTSTEIAGIVEKELDEEQYSENSLVKIVLNGNVDVECEKNIDYVLSKIENRFFFVKIYDYSRIMVNYDDFMLDMSLKGEFVRMVKSANDLDEDMKSEVIRMGIKALTGE